MGVLPMQFLPEQNRESLGLTGLEEYFVEGIPAAVASRGTGARFAPWPPTGPRRASKRMVRIDTPVEAEYYRNGGILPYVLRQLASSKRPPLTGRTE